MNDTLRRCLEDLEARIDPQVEDELLEQWMAFAEGRFEGDLFSPSRGNTPPPTVDWPRPSINQALEDYDLMALQQYGLCSQVLAGGSGAILNVRSNYGSSIMPMLFGVEPFIMDDEFDCLPTSLPFNDIASIERLLESGVPDPNGGFGERVFEMGRRFMAIAAEYPKIGKYIFVYHPDTQGPMDICEVVWGSSMFYSLYDRPDLVKALLELATEAYIRFMRAWIEIAPFREGGNAHWGFYHKGNIMIRDDSAMNLSPDMFDEFIKPYDQRLLDTFGGGAIHFCGKGDHYMPNLSKMNDVFAVHMSQPEYNDMEVMFHNTVDRGINMLGLKPEVGEAAVAQGRNLHGRVQAYAQQRTYMQANRVVK